MQLQSLLPLAEDRLEAPSPVLVSITTPSRAALATLGYSIAGAPSRPSRRELNQLTVPPKTPNSCWVGLMPPPGSFERQKGPRWTISVISLEILLMVVLNPTVFQVWRVCVVREEGPFTLFGYLGWGLWTWVNRQGLSQAHHQCCLRYQGKLFNQAVAESSGYPGDLIGSLDQSLIEKRKFSQMLYCGSLNIW